MAKAEIHPTWYPDAKVICNGEVVMTTGSTQPEIHVDVWSGNHPFYTGTQKILDTEGRVDRFMRKYGMGSADSATAGQEKAKSAQAAPKAEPTAKPEAAAAVPAAKAAEGA
ncbi:MAG: 50S ribosomal protein L31 [Cyanobacteriota bacterium]|nr:50S ribosomal protein L31 [Cyanobacteriota bacterium]